MATEFGAIVVAGDVTVDWLAMPVPPVDAPAGHGPQPCNWELFQGTHMVARAGGAMLAAKLTEAATSTHVITHHLSNLESLAPDEVIHSLHQLDLVPRTKAKADEKNKVYRVSHLAGFAGPHGAPAPPVPIHGDDAKAVLVILDDAGNGFRDTPSVWPAAIAEGCTPIIILKMSRPLGQGPLWEHLRRHHADRLVVVLSAEDLRRQGIDISRRLSWERTATDFVWQMASNRELLSLSSCANLIVRFGIDAAIHYTRRAGVVRSELHYDPAVAEDGFAENYPGEMVGYACAFVGALAAGIMHGGLGGLPESIRSGIIAQRRLLQLGLGATPLAPELPGAELFAAPGPHDKIAEVAVPNPTATEPADPGFWCILKDLAGQNLENVAYKMVREGDMAGLTGVPVGEFGKLKTVDRAEIESYRTVRNLILEYRANLAPKRPLCIAVFGQPGAGKSFGVTEVAKSVAEEDIKRLEFNVAQFTSPKDLIDALHKVRDEALSGKLPLVFFDEFDANFEDTPFGWLKYFLAPMQDGAFKDGEAMHPIGKAIFVFAGGTSHSFDEFCRECAPPTLPSIPREPVEEIQAPDARPTSCAAKPAVATDAELEITDRQVFQAAKGPDFLSRLRGYVDIIGPNPTGPDDVFYLVRRAILLRSLLESKAKGIFDSTKRASIDDGVLRAFIRVPHYKHASRSMEALLDMSSLAGARSFQQAALPPFAQLRLHVDAEMFSRLVVRDVLLYGAREPIAKAIHEEFRANQKGTKPDDHPSMQPWEQLDEGLKDSNRQQADHIPEKLRHVGCGYGPVTDPPAKLVDFTPEEIEVLAELEHDRWVSERLLKGWSFGAVNDKDLKTNPCLVPWGDLTEEVKDWDRQAVRLIPKLLSIARFEVYRLE